MHTYRNIIGRLLNIGSDFISWYWALDKGGNCELKADEETTLNMRHQKRLNRENPVSLSSIVNWSSMYKSYSKLWHFDSIKIAIDVIIDFLYFLKLQGEEQDRTP